jgi:hypothetical protein
VPAASAHGGQRPAESSSCARADGAPISACTTAFGAPSNGVGDARQRPHITTPWRRAGGRAYRTSSFGIGADPGHHEHRKPSTGPNPTPADDDRLSSDGSLGSCRIPRLDTPLPTYNAIMSAALEPLPAFTARCLAEPNTAGPRLRVWSRGTRRLGVCQIRYEREPKRVLHLF